MPTVRGFALFFQGDGQTNGPFADGRLCAAGTVVRLATKSHTGSATYPAVGDLSVSVRGLVVAPGARYEQLRYYRAARPCANGSNLTNASSVIWIP